MLHYGFVHAIGCLRVSYLGFFQHALRSSARMSVFRVVLCHAAVVVCFCCLDFLSSLWCKASLGVVLFAFVHVRRVTFRWNAGNVGHDVFELR